MLNNGFHPEKITEGNKRFIIKIVKDRQVLGPVDEFLMDETVNVLHLLQQAFQILLIIITMGIHPNMLKKGGTCLNIQYMIQ